MDHERHLFALRHEGEALAAAARHGLDRRVPSCPDWDVAALVAHAGRAYRWVTHIVDTHAADEVRLDDMPAPPADGVLEWYEDSLATLVETITNETPDTPVWNWSEQDMTVAFWSRRMANETAVHRWDAQLAYGMEQPIEPDLAADGVDELLVSFLSHGLFKRPVDGRHATFLVQASDTGDAWYGTLLPDSADVRRGTGNTDADATLRGTASDLLLALWGRDVRVDATGDESVVALLLE
jgi:uncharacterized protein (TIGR03083 family)